jgi:ATP-dependent helicase/DNAse subunit B
MDHVGLSLVVGPAHAGKIALLLERYLESIDRDPWLIVPNRSDVDRVERDLLRRQPALLGGHIGTFDDLFRELVRGDVAWRPKATDAQRSIAVRRAVATADLSALGASARTSGFGDALAAALGELESALIPRDRLEGDLAGLAATYDRELERLGLWDRDRTRRRAVERLASDLAAWSGAPVFAYGFEDLTAAEWELLGTLAGRTDLTVSLPYEPGRPAFVSLRRTAEDLAEIAAGDIVELQPGSDRHLPATLAHVERALFATEEQPKAPLDAGALRFLEGAGTRGTAELVAQEVAELVRGGKEAAEIALVCDSVERWRAPLETVLGALGIPYAIEERVRLSQTAFGSALLGLLRFAWLGGGRGELFGFLRSPFSGLSRPAVDYVEGRLRGRAVHTPERVEEESERLRGGPVPFLGELRAAPSAVAGARATARAMASAAYGLGTPPTGESSTDDLRALEATLRVLDELEVVERLDAEPLPAEDVVGALERAAVRPSGAGEPGRVAVLDLPRARTRRFDVVFVLGLEEGSLPRRGRTSPFLDDDHRRSLGGRLERPDPVERDRYLFYTACTRPRERLVLVREAASDDGVPREPSPFWEETTRLFDAAEVARATKHRPLSALTWELEDAPTERERLRALAGVASKDKDEARALAASNGWSRRLDRALSAFSRRTALRSPDVLAWLGQRTTFAAAELERFADCSSAWLVERVIAPKTIDAEPDPMLRGSVAHTALHRFYQALPKELGVDCVTPDVLEQATALVRRSLDEALQSGVRLELTDLQAAELRQTLLRDLEGFVRDEAASGVGFVPRRFEVSFGSDRAAPELQRGLELGDGLTLSGRIDRIDLDPFSARGIVQDYKSGKHAHSAEEIDRDLRLQIPLYMLVLRDLVGVEPLGGIYKPLAGKRTARGMLRASAADDLPGFVKTDYLDEDRFWERVDAARTRAGEYGQRIRAGDVRHDPKGDGCPQWCDLWTVCRIERS